MGQLASWGIALKSWDLSKVEKTKDSNCFANHNFAMQSWFQERTVRVKLVVYMLDSKHSYLRHLLRLSALPEKHKQKRILFQLPRSNAMILAVTPPK